MHSVKFYGLFSFVVLVLLLGVHADPRLTRSLPHAEEIIEYHDIPNRIAWLPAGSDLVINFILSLSNNMLKHYGLVLERIKQLRATVQSYPPAYNSVALFFDNDIQHPLDGGSSSHKPSPYKTGSGEAFKAAFETIQKFAGRRVQPFVKH